MRSCSSFSPKFHPLHVQAAGWFRTLQLPLMAEIHGVRKRQSMKYCSFNSSHKVGNSSEDISNKNYKAFNKYRVHVTLQDGYAPKSAADDNILINFLLNKLNTLFHFTRPYTWIGSVIAISSVSFLPLQSLAELTPTFFMGILKALVPSVLMNIYVVASNQLFDVEIDKVNKPYLPLASGEFSMGIGIAIALLSSSMSLAMGVMSRSPPLILALIIWFLLGSAYSIQLPFLRWKGNTFLAPMSMMILMGLVYQLLFFMHIQKYVLARPVVITKPLIFATAIMCVFSLANGLLKDVPDVDGDREFNIQTLCVTLGKEKVFWLCVYMISAAYGAAVLVGASSSFILNKLVTVISHSILANILWLRVRTVDLSSNASTLCFYIFFWKLTYIEYLLIHFVR